MLVAEQFGAASAALPTISGFNPVPSATLPVADPFTQSTYSGDPNRKNAYSIQWNFGQRLGGHPFRPAGECAIACDIANTGNIGERPNVIGDWHVDNPTPARWFAKEAFAARSRYVCVPDFRFKERYTTQSAALLCVCLCIPQILPEGREPWGMYDYIKRYPGCAGG